MKKIAAILCVGICITFAFSQIQEEIQETVERSVLNMEKKEREEEIYSLDISQGELVIRRNQMIYEQTGIKEEMLSKEDLDLLREGIYRKTLLEIYNVLESFTS